MAKSHDNNATFGMSGRVGQFVYRQWFGKTVVSKTRRPGSQEPTPDVLTRRTKFREAILFAKNAIQNAQLKAIYSIYANRGKSALNMAFSDRYHAPVIGEIDSSAYGGNAGEMINVPVTDNFKVASVQVKISLPDGTLLEQGSASVRLDGITWEYSSSMANGSLHGSMISITAMDHAGNTSVKSKTL